MSSQQFTNQLQGQLQQTALIEVVDDPADMFIQTSKTLRPVDSDSDEGVTNPRHPSPTLSENQLHLLRTQILAYKTLTKNIVPEQEFRHGISLEMWKSQKKALKKAAIERQRLKLDNQAEIKAMVSTKVVQKHEQIAQEKAIIEQAKPFVERRKNEIQSILDRFEVSSSLRDKLINEHKFLSLRDLQLKYREKITDGMMRDYRQPRYFQERLLDRIFFKRDKPIRGREGDGKNDKAMALLRTEEDRQKHARHKQIMQSLYTHQAEFMQFHKKRLKALKKRAQVAKVAYELNQKKKEEEENQIQRQKLIALKKNDIETYLKLQKDSKNKKIQELLRQTHQFLKELGAKVLVQKGQKPDQEEDTEANKQQISYLTANKIYYNLTHSINEKIETQPSYLTGGTLKHYQLVGLQWLVSLYNNNLNGILADEMGLGKTIQTISLFSYIMEFKMNHGPFLIVVPLTTLPNWNSEFEKWAPSIKRIVYRGSQAERNEIYRQLKTTKWHVCITTFDFVLKDRYKLNKFEWKYIVIDEGHRIKNAKCKFVSVLVHDYASDHRLLLTGTPLQNNLSQLWSLLNFLLPKVFNDSGDFQKWFSIPISKTLGNEVVTLTEQEKLLIINRLHQVLRPFLLRRVKKEVESQLPDKREQIIKVELSSWQRVIYENIRNGVFQFNPNNNKFGNRTFSNLLMQLKKCCNHPFMFLNNYEDLITNDFIFRSSGKFELLDRILPKLIAFNHRILIFFQMTTIMDIMEAYLNYKRIKYLRLDGCTKADLRGQITNAFNSANSPYDVFILSTRAGGLGLNLQSADTVIIYDPDWNPQMDKQAEDRAHRIGQKKQVLVLRLITNTMVEEEIVSRAEEKINMEQLFIQGGLFNLKSSEAQRRQKLQHILKRQKNGENQNGAEIPDDEMINKYISRSQEEFQSFNKMDQLRYDEQGQSGKYPSFVDPRTAAEPINYRLLGDNEIPQWLNQTQKPQQEKEYGRGNRTRKQVNYNDELIDMQIEEIQKLNL